MQNGVAMAERAAFDILAGETHRCPVAENRCERKLLRRRPVDRAFVVGVEDGRTFLADAFELAVDGEAVRQADQGCIQLAELLDRNCRLRLRCCSRRRTLGLRLNVILLRLERVQRLLQVRHLRPHQLLGGVGRHLTSFHQRARPDLPDGWMRRDLFVHQRLGERGFVPFVVPVPAITDQIDEEVALKLLAVGDRETRRFHARFGIIRVHVNDRNLESARQAAGVRSAVFVLGAGGETKLVVDDDVDRAAGVVGAEPRQVERFGHDALAGEGGIAMDQDRHAAGRLELRRSRFVSGRSRSSRHPEHHGIDRLEMTGIRRHRDDDVHCGAAFDRSPRAGVILDVAGPRHVFLEHLAGHRLLELGEDLRVRLVQDVRHHVEAAAVRHPEQDVADAELRRVADDFVEDGHEHVEPFDREARLAGERAMQEPLECLDLGQALEQRGRIDRIGRRSKAS